jgi:5-methylcytosine-specific restriction protein B
MIADDPTLGPGFRIGHSYFCRNGSSAPWGDDPEAWVRSVFRFEIVPLLREYWYDDPGQLDDALRVLGVAAV